MSSAVTVNISGKEYQIGCPEEEKQALIASAEMLNSNMEKIRSTGKVVGVDRIAVMAALNLAHELLSLQSAGDSGADGVTQKVGQMNDRISAFLDEARQLDL